MNNAGIGRPGSAVDMSEKDWQDVIDINLTGVFHMSQIVGKVMIKQGFGNIVNTASMSAFIANFQAEQINYYASKAGVVMLTKALAAEWAPYGIRVNAIAPGYMRTAQCHKSFTDPACADMVGNWFRLTPAGRPGEPDELGGSVVFLASEASGYLTGHTLVVDGGSTVY